MQQLSATPSDPLHRFRTRSDCPADGDARRGVSFFAPTSHGACFVFSHLKKLRSNCVVTVPLLDLPAQLRLVCDGPLMAPVTDEDSVSCGLHYTLFPISDMSAAEFEHKYEQLMATCSSCDVDDQAASAGLLELDDDRMPADGLSYSAVMALEDLAANSEDPNVVMFASLYALHVRAIGMNCSELCQVPYLARMVASALDTWTCYEYLMYVDALRAQTMLAATLENYVPIKTKFRPYWEVSAFQFLSGEYNDQLYDQQVKTCAPFYRNDMDLRKEIEDAASQLFAELQHAQDASEKRETKFKHRDITFCVVCALNQAPVPRESNNMQRMA